MKNSSGFIKKLEFMEEKVVWVDVYKRQVLNTVERIGDVYYLVIEQRQYRIEIKMRTG